MGYPSFFNDVTEDCDLVSFKWFCERSSSGISNLILPLIQSRRHAMNSLATQLNQVLLDVANSYRSPLVQFVNTDPWFDGHRFCEAGVKEPSYRNPNTWFYPLEYWTGGTLIFDPDAVGNGNCTALYGSDNEDYDWGNYYACEIADAVLAANVTLNLTALLENVPGGNDISLTSSGGSGALPSFLARVFHPTINGMTAYTRAIEAAYSLGAANVNITINSTASDS
jgi:hypothetical protein